MNDALRGAAETPQANGFEVLVFNGTVNDQNAQKLINSICAAHTNGRKGVWVSIQSGGGCPGAARYVHSFLRSVEFPAIAHVCDVFSEGASLAAAFPYRTISPVGKIGFHQATMNLTAGGYGEAKLSDLLQQVKGHNRAMVAPRPEPGTADRDGEAAGVRRQGVRRRGGAGGRRRARRTDPAPPGPG